MVYAVIFHIFFGGLPGMVVRDALDGAIRRLARPECQRLFGEFTDRDGVSLASKLDALGETAAGHLSATYFADGDRLPACANDASNVAFTAPGSHVVYICSTRFGERFARKTIGAEILIIHELLHTLGLGENPPTSAQITDRVRAQCGD